MIAKALLDVARGFKLYPVWLHHAYYGLSSKYKRTILGSLWIVGAILSTSISLTIVMGGIMGQSVSELLPYIMGGMMAFSLCGYMLNEAPECFVSSAGLIKNHPYPFSYFIFENLSRLFMLFLHNLVAFYVVALILRANVFPNPLIIVSLILVFINSALWGSVTATLAARFKDLRFMLPFVSQIIFFLTPIFWRADHMSGWRSIIVEANPFYGLVEIIRAPMLGQMPAPHAWMLSISSLLLGLVVWLIVFSVNRSKIAFWV